MTAPASPPRRASTRLLLALLAFYKACLSPVAFGFCKFYPTCSAYAREAIARHGVWRGARLALARFLRCRPFAPGGYDPVPERGEIG